MTVSMRGTSGFAHRFIYAIIIFSIYSISQVNPTNTILVLPLVEIHAYRRRGVHDRRMKGRLAVAVASRAVLARGIAHVTTPTAIAARRQAAGR